MRIARIAPVLALLLGVVLTGGTAQAAPSGPERLASPVAPATAQGPGAKEALYSTTNGKLTYDLSDGNNGACSASSVNSPSGRVVLTAAHCVHRLGPQPSNFVYHPGYQRGDKLPSFTVAHVVPAPQWAERRDRKFDYAFLVLNDLPDGRRVAEVAGAHGLIINTAYREQVHVAGYPWRIENGEAQWHCAGVALRDDGSNRHKITCDGNDGASGGPWLRNYQPSGLGDVISVTSSNVEKVNRGPYLGPEARDLYNSVKDL
ncbi:trypsin-like peptidase domain-containing protein [Crossiella sp. CA-258035]|uniref:trypsin-like serine peptidase n=1 Tax=Crossiella sp. CA-258035 TaxID=2981138 RepID=UPI0024BCA739|nr:trypsin-like serine protease [Crossiella sp. CA-258035]WHT18141.1 trypsin-like peptidase domain-containing protein [Crossiella sp. CA-258035]